MIICEDLADCTRRRKGRVVVLVNISISEPIMVCIVRIYIFIKNIYNIFKKHIQTAVSVKRKAFYVIRLLYRMGCNNLHPDRHAYHIAMGGPLGESDRDLVPNYCGTKPLTHTIGGLNPPVSTLMSRHDFV